MNNTLLFRSAIRSGLFAAFPILHDLAIIRRLKDRIRLILLANQYRER
jgi:hypothetical protein